MYKTAEEFDREWEAHFRARRERLVREALNLLERLDDAMIAVLGDSLMFNPSPAEAKRYDRLNRAHTAARARYIRRGGALD